MKIISIAIAAAVIAAVSPASANVVRGPGVAIGGPTVSIECPGGREVCTTKNGKKVCSCLGPIST